MERFEDLYHHLLADAAGGKAIPEFTKKSGSDFRPLDCLLHPQKYAPVWQVEPCSCPDKPTPSCISACIFKAIKKDNTGTVIIEPERCVGCSACIAACKSGALTASRDILPALDAIKNAKGPVYAMIAPAFIGQFSKNVTPGKLRNAFKKIGFAGMVEVALFADILTLKESLEFDQMIRSHEDYMITSCCCPIWIAMIRKIYQQLIPHVPGSVSPMVACGRSIKKMIPNATTIFIGPCVAKKAEAREPDIKDAVDIVLTFEEIQDIFDAFQVHPAEEQDDSRDHSSKAGRIYARTRGVSQAVSDTVKRLRPDRTIGVTARQADGVPACREMLALLREGKIDANFVEGMGCPGGCVGGPKAILNRADGTENVNQYGEQAAYDTPVDNPFVLELLKQLGFQSVEALLEDSKLFTRDFKSK